MTPLFVPTLTELEIKLQLAETSRAVSEDNPNYEAALMNCWSILDQIADLPARTLADLRIKARTFDWSAQLLEGEPYRNPSDGEVKIMRQLVAGLMDERIV